MNSKNHKQNPINAQLSYADYSADQHKDINDMILMCSEIDQSSIDHLGGVFKLAIIAGTLRIEDSNALLKSDPYLMKIVIGGLRTNLAMFNKSQRGKPVKVRAVFDALLHYKRLIIDDHMKYKASIAKIHTRKRLASAIYKALPPVEAGAPLFPIFSGGA
jgi:hypothetical protein